MTQLIIYQGTVPDDGTGDNPLVAWGKANANFTELYTAPILSGILTAGGFNATGSALPANGMYLSAANTVAWATNSVLRWSVDGAGNGLLTGSMTAPNFVTNSNTIPSVGMSGNSALTLSTNSLGRLVIASTGGVTLTPSSGVGLTVNAAAGTHSTQIADSTNAKFDAGFLGAASATAGTAVLADRGKTIVITANLAIPNATFAAGDQMRVYNNTAGALTLTATITTMRLDGSATTGNRTLAQRGLATIYFVSGTECVVSGAAVT